jgi:hypothetical protein
MPSIGSAASGVQVVAAARYQRARRMPANGQRRSGPKKLR